MTRKWEDSPADRRSDRKGAKRMGVTVKAYERTAEDKRADAKAQRKVERKR
jgi:hypothetical protein